jgi:hypothetical protein
MGTILGAAVALLLVTAPAAVVTAETSTTTTIDPALTTTSTSSTSTTTTSTSTTTTLPSAVTTVPEGCAGPPEAQAVFVGTVTAIDPVSATFEVSQVRAGSLEGYAAGASVEIRYGADVKFLDVGTTYIVGARLDPVSQRLSSTIRDSADLFGGNEVIDGGVECPSFEESARTINLDGTGIESGVFSNFLGDPVRLLVALVLPGALVLVGLVTLVWVRRATRL